jgi:hypothetical protein
MSEEAEVNEVNEVVNEVNEEVNEEIPEELKNEVESKIEKADEEAIKEAIKEQEEKKEGGRTRFFPEDDVYIASIEMMNFDFEKSKKALEKTMSWCPMR